MAIQYGTAQAALLARLGADEQLAALLPGGIWNRPLRPPPQDGATAGAFEPVVPYRVRPCAVTPDAGEARATGGPSAAFDSFPEIWLYAPTTESGKAAIDAAVARMRTTLVGWWWATPDGTCVVIDGIADRLGKRDAPELDGAIVDRLRLQCSGLWQQETE